MSPPLSSEILVIVGSSQSIHIRRLLESNVYPNLSLGIESKYDRTMKSQVTTGHGDAGHTRTLGGDAVSKADPAIDCTGSVDAVRARIALLRLEILERKPADAETIAEFLFWLLHVLFLVGTQCSDPKKRKPEYWHEPVAEKHLLGLEAYQAKLESEVTLPKQFTVSAGTILGAQTDVAVTEVRRLERAIVRLQEAVPEFDTTHLLPLINRLSDTLYLLARKLDDGNFIPLDYSVLD
jgi:ATP:cob(I)alamin adenosyltransferase